jgi:hypothetical protein
MDIAIHVSAKRCAVALGLITALVVAASIGASFLSFVPIHNPLLTHVRETVVRLAWLDEECNIPAWYSAGLLLACSFLLVIIASAHRQLGDGYAARWLGLSLIFGFLSLDETAQLHELSIAPLRQVFHPTGFLYYPWIILGGIGLALFLLSYLRFLAKLPRRTWRLFVLAGVLFVGGALGVEAVSAKLASLHGEHTSSYHAITTLEELLEMAGLVVFIYALLDYISRQFTTLRVHVASR